MPAVLPAQGHVISCSLDSTVKVWQMAEAPAPGAVLDTTPVYVHPPEEAASSKRGRPPVRWPSNMDQHTCVSRFSRTNGCSLSFSLSRVSSCGRACWYDPLV